MNKFINNNKLLLIVVTFKNSVHFLKLFYYEKIRPQNKSWKLSTLNIQNRKYIVYTKKSTLNEEDYK